MTTDEPSELSVRDGFTMPCDLPRGDCILTRLEDGSVRVDHADPRVLISGELLDDIIRHPSEHVWFEFAHCTATDEGMVKIKGVNRMVIYRVTQYVAAVHGYVAEWPD